MIRTIEVVEAADFPNDVRKYCADRDITTHSEHSIVCIDDDGNPLAKWLKSQGFVFSDKGWDWIGVFGT